MSVSVNPSQSAMTSTDVLVLGAGAAVGALLAYKMGATHPVALICAAVASAVIALVVYRAAKKNEVGTHCYNLNGKCPPAILQTILDALPQIAKALAGCNGGNLLTCLSTGAEIIKNP